MLTNKQLVSTGFSFILDMLEPWSPYGEELARKPHFYTVSEHEELVSELKNVSSLHSLLETRSREFTAVERILMQFKDVRNSVSRSLEFTLSDVELFEIKRFLIGLERFVPAYSELTAGVKLADIEIQSFTEALNIIDPDGMRTLTFRVSDVCSEDIANIRAERRRIDLALRVAKDADKERLTVERTIIAAKEEAEEARLRAEMTKRFSKFAVSIENTICSIAKLDFAMAKARLMKKLGGIIPKVSIDSAKISIAQMVNPRTQAVLREKGREFTPLSLDLSTGSTVVTGANMGGKSIAVKTLALTVQLALSGMPVFCKNAEIPHFSEIYLLCEDMEDSLNGLSSFGGEMVRFDKIISASNAGLSLVLLDEFARGTNPHEGSALVRAAVKYFNKNEKYVALITTHFDDIARYANFHYQVMGLRNADRTALSSALAGENEQRARALEGFMDYGLYPVERSVNPPRDAITICQALNVSKAFMSLVED